MFVAVVSALHHRYKDVMDIIDIDDIRNGLLLSQPVKWAFDTSRLSLVCDRGVKPPSFHAVLIDHNIAGIKLIDKLVELNPTVRGIDE
jgi:hypothetical protein